METKITHIVDGAWVFWLVDTKGFPLELAREEFRKRGWALYVPQFIEAAIKSKNYTFQTVTDKLLRDIPEKGKKEYTKQLAMIYYMEGYRRDYD